MRLIPDPADIKHFGSELSRRQEVRLASGLPPLDEGAEMRRFVLALLASEYRQRLQPYIAPILAATPASGAMCATMTRHYNALRGAQLRLFEAEGVLPPDGQFGPSDRF